MGTRLEALRNPLSALVPLVLFVIAIVALHRLAPAWHKVGRFIYRHGEDFYNFDGLRQYKEKFLPEWRPRYLAAPGRLALPRVLFDVTTLISGGARSAVREGLPP